MGEQKVTKSKIGARALTKAEAKLILPTYEQIEKQIEQFRYEKEKRGNRQDVQGELGEEQNSIQKTNNIGIIGVRGAGKTSLLKTIREDLYRDNQQRKEKDLIFPIIVPENMSESSTLMASILGMFKKFVEERVKEEKKKERNLYVRELCERDNGSLERKYNEVIKQYTFIQKDYRNILIQEYTTENDYVRESAKVFNSDVEFIHKFNELVDLLVEGKEQRMIFLFIDDIDLSTYRCADVVKTLLSYLSNENIVTFISGDLETFEEALALDFLRQEGVISENILGESMLSGAEPGTILENKKKLVYEYLKKIIPPVYRHNIKRWTLGEKGKYRIDSVEGDEEKSGKNLSECLLEALQGWVDPAFFQYIEEVDGKEDKVDVLPYTYHLFDDTSRGLNNVYIVLNEIIDKRKMERDGSKNTFIREKKQLLDTIISSKPLYSQYRDQIRNAMFVAGEENSEVFFDNAYSIIYSQEHSQNSLEDYPVECFSLFVFVDFAARLLYEKDYLKKVEENRSYIELKENAVKDLFFHPSIAEKVRKVELDEKKWKKIDKESSCTSILDLNISFLVKGDFVFNLAFYHGLPLEEIWEECNLKINEGDNSRKIEQDTSYTKTNIVEQKVSFAFEKAIVSITKCNHKEVLVSEEYYSIFWKEFNFIQDRISDIPVQNLSLGWFNAECQEAAKTELKNLKIMERLLSNTMADMITLEWNEKDDEKYVKSIINAYEEISEKNGSKKDSQQRIRIITIVDNKNFWSELALGKLVEYLKKNIQEELINIRKHVCAEDDEQLWKINIKNAKNNLAEFFDSGHGKSNNTKYASAKQKITSILREECYKSIQKYFYNKELENWIMENGISYASFLEIIKESENLAQNFRVWYGRVEAQELRNGLMKSTIQMDEKQEEELSEFRFYLHYYFRYKMAVSDIGKVRRQAERLKKITEGLSTAHQSANQKVLNQFIAALNESLDVKIDGDVYNKLFD